MTDSGSAPTTRDILLERLNNIRPNLRSEYMETIGRAAPPGVDKTVFKDKVFDYERAPHIEKKGIQQGIAIVTAVVDSTFRSDTIYLLTCLNRLELYFYELMRPEKEPDEDQSHGRRSLMYKTGVRKVIRETAALLPAPTSEIWFMRRRMLNVLENDLWRVELGTADASIMRRLDEIMMLADTLHTMTPAAIAAFKTNDDMTAAFTSAAGPQAHLLVSFIQGSDATTQ